MAAGTAKKMAPKKILVRDLNPYLTCTLCGGYYIDATALVDCLHVFCRGCILRYFENCKQACPTCNTVYKKKNAICFRPDSQLQTLVYKLVPALHSKEMQRREDFYRSTGVRASSSCSDDSVLGDMMQDHEKWVSSYVADEQQFYSPDDPISLSLEYYQHYLDTTSEETRANASADANAAETDANAAETSANPVDKRKRNGQLAANEVDANDSKTDGREVKKDAHDVKGDGDSGEGKRFLQCPAAVSMSHLQKFVRMKYGLSEENMVDIIYAGEVLPLHFSLMDVAYIFKWSGAKPLRFFYRIFTPMKVRPIKIINTSSGGGKQLQIVPVNPSVETIKKEEAQKPAITPVPEKTESESEKARNKEQLLANLQLQSKSKMHSFEKEKVKEKRKSKTPEPASCVYEYEDEEEKKRFAEKRDREWAMQKRLDEQEESRHVSKKRKKNKHSKNESVHKKRKLHAEITSNEVLNKEESLKLKVKITPHNGHKHKHHRNSQIQTVEISKPPTEMSSKEKLLQMRAVRHKHNISNDEKSVQTVPTATSTPIQDKSTHRLPPESSQTPDKLPHRPPKPHHQEKPTSQPSKTTPQPTKTPQEAQKTDDKTKPSINLKSNELPINKTSVPEQAPVKLPTKSPEGIVSSSKTLRSDFSIKTNASKELSLQPQPTVNVERVEPTDRQAQKTFLKTFQPHAEKYNRAATEKVAPVRPEGSQAKMTPKGAPQTASKPAQQQPMNALERKIANLKQQCTIEPKNGTNLNDKRPGLAKPEKKVAFTNDKPHILNSKYPAGFTVSKIEQGVKRKQENDFNVRDKRPSLEITLIPQQTQTQPEKPPVEIKTAVKRPPPPTIPLEKIKNSINFKSGVSITPKKLPDRCDNIGALDLSKPGRSPGEIAQQKSSEAIKSSPVNGINSSILSMSKDIASRTPQKPVIPPKVPTKTPTETKNVNISNLQMLSKVASEHPTLNKPVPGQNPPQNKPKPQMPSLHTLKIPMLQNATQKTLPKLTEIGKGFRPMSAPVRTMRPNQNQSIRNIPNPSLLVRQQNQNRMNSMGSATPASGETKEAVKPQQQQESVSEKVKSTSEQQHSSNSAVAAGSS